MSVLDRIEGEYGEEGRAATEAFAGDLYVLTFQENRRGGDPVAHTPEGKTVFPDKFRGGVDIMAGDTWLCEVTSKGGSTFFAAPLRRIDTSFFVDLVEDQIDLIARVALQEYRTELDPELEAAAAKEADLVLRQQVETLSEENEALRGRLAELEELYDEAGERIRRHEGEVRDLRTRLEDVDDAEHGGERGALRSTLRAAARPSQHETARIGRVDADALSSEAFVHERYYGHLSPDGTRLFLKAHGNGNLFCTEGTLRIPGLGQVVPFAAPQTYQGEYDPRHGGWFVRL